MTRSTRNLNRQMTAHNTRVALRPALLLRPTLLLLMASLGFGCASNIAPNVAQYEDGVRKQFAALASIEQSSRALQQTVVLYRAATADGADEPLAPCKRISIAHANRFPDFSGQMLFEFRQIFRRFRPMKLHRVRPDRLHPAHHRLRLRVHQQQDDFDASVGLGTQGCRRIKRNMSRTGRIVDEADMRCPAENGGL